MNRQTRSRIFAGASMIFALSALVMAILAAWASPPLQQPESMTAGILLSASLISGIFIIQ